MIDLNERVEMMTRNVIGAALHFDLWGLHIRDAAWEETARYREEFDEIWSLSSLAHRFTFYVRLNAAYAESSKANTIPRLIRECENRFANDQLVRAKAELSELGPIIKKVEKLRNNIYAHQSRQLTIPDAYKEVGVTMDELADLASRSIDLMNAIRGALGLDLIDVGRRHIEQFADIMDAIEQRTANV